MAIKSIKEMPNSGKVEIDLNGPDGNSFVLMSYARMINRDKKLNLDMNKIIFDEMMGGDRENLILVFEKYFGDYANLYI
jgi:hypothetical protein